MSVFLKYRHEQLIEVQFWLGAERHLSVSEQGIAHAPLNQREGRSFARSRLKNMTPERVLSQLKAGLSSMIESQYELTQLKKVYFELAQINFESA